MRILHTEASLGWGGQEIRILTEAAGMSVRGHHVELVCPREAQIFNEAPRFGVNVTALPIGRKRPPGLLALIRAEATRIDTDLLFPTPTGKDETGDRAHTSCLGRGPERRFHALAVHACDATDRDHGRSHTHPADAKRRRRT